MKKLYRTEDLIFLYLMKDKLEKSGIHCFIKNAEISGPAAGELPPITAIPELWVIEKDVFSQALEMLHEELNLRRSFKKKWICSNCKESLEGQFNICWKCGHGKD